MQIRSRAYLRFVWLWRLIREMVPPHYDNASVRTSPLLIYVAVILTSLLVMLDMGRHSAELGSTGLVRNGYLSDPTFVGP